MVYRTIISIAVAGDSGVCHADCHEEDCGKAPKKAARSSGLIIESRDQIANFPSGDFPYAFDCLTQLLTQGVKQASQAVGIEPLVVGGVHHDYDHR